MIPSAIIVSSSFFIHVLLVVQTKCPLGQSCIFYLNDRSDVGYAAYGEWMHGNMVHHSMP